MDNEIPSFLDLRGYPSGDWKEHDGVLQDPFFDPAITHDGNLRP